MGNALPRTLDLKLNDTDYYLYRASYKLNHPSEAALPHVCGVALFLEQRPNTKTPLSERRWRIPVHHDDERRQNILNPVHPLQVEKYTVSNH
ncbi:hypothetical protein EMIT0194MI4_10405 [Pseudomonas sp. IT-194MI4]